MKSTVKIWRESKERYKYLGRIGKVVSWTRLAKGNRVMVLVEFENKTRTLGEGLERKIKMGDEVEGVLRKLGETGKRQVIEYGVKWKKR